MRKYYLILTILLSGLWMTSCENTPVERPEPVDEDPKTLIIYGSIGEPYITDNVKAAGRAIAQGALIKGQRVLVYHEKSSGDLIYELLRDRKVRDGFSRDTLARYAPGEISAFDPDDMRAVLEKIRSLAPAQHYGLIMGMHATGWVPRGTALSRSSKLGQLWEVPENPITRYLGTNSHGMNIGEFVEAAGGMDWNFILFDACLMSSVEAAYDMRGLAPYLILSPAEILIEGFPYDRIVKTLFSDWTDLRGVARAYVDYYRSNDSYATISLIETAELEGLAQSLRRVRMAGYNEVDPIRSVIQPFEGLNNHVFFDLDDYVRRWARNQYTYWDFYNQLQRAVPFYDHTDKFVTRWARDPVPIVHYSGLTAFIPHAGAAELSDAYRNTAWYRAIYED